MKNLLVASFTGLLLVMDVAAAHSPVNSIIPVLRCWNNIAEVVCRSGRSNGVRVDGAILEVFGPDGELLAALKTDSNGLVHFAKPHGRFTVLLHDVRGSGQTVEVDQRDVDVTEPAI